MKIAVIGATGNLGGAVTREATARGHQVTALGSSNVDAADPASIKEAVTGHDADTLENESFIPGPLHRGVLITVRSTPSGTSPVASGTRT